MILSIAVPRILWALTLGHVYRRTAMLASPLYGGLAPFASEGVNYMKDLDSFNNLLPPPIEFVEGSSSGLLTVSEEQYEPINATPKTVKPQVGLSRLLPLSS